MDKRVQVEPELHDFSITLSLPRTMARNPDVVAMLEEELLERFRARVREIAGGER